MSSAETDSLLVTETEFTPKAQELLAVLRGRPGEWLNRTQLAIAVGKSGDRLNPNDIRQLKNLADAGVIEMLKRPIDGPISFEWVYRAADNGG